jgi:hypothetical protein
MRHILMLLTVVALMMAMTIVPAVAQGPPSHARLQSCFASDFKAFGPHPYCNFG